jgi:3-mercaptopyruvate sulfurtransferase SseA
MKKAFIQLSLIVGISIVLGGIYNFAISSSANYLSFKVKKGRYDSVKKCEEATGVGNTIPGTGTPSVTPATVPPVPGTPDPVEPGTPAEKKNPAPAEDEAKTPRILVDEAFEEWESGSLFIDARRTKVYVKGHIPGAVSISPWENTREERVLQLPEKEELADPVVVYCTRSKDCEDSEMISGDLKALGFTNVLIFQGGYPVWQEQEKPVTEGEEAGERPGQ